MASPITFHVQIFEDKTSQLKADSLRLFFGRQDVIEALNDSGVIQFARIIYIPIDPEKPDEGTFGIQVIIVYDDPLEKVLEYLWNSPPLRSLFVTISSIARRPAKSLSDYKGFADFINDNNLNPKPKELRNAYRLTIAQIKDAFANNPI